jgi:hypothetical protein
LVTCPAFLRVFVHENAEISKKALPNSLVKFHSIPHWTTT